MVGWQRHMQSLVRNLSKTRLDGSSSVISGSRTTPPLYHYSRHSGISSSRNPVAESLSEQQTLESKSEQVKPLQQVQYVLKGVTQDPNKIDLVGKLVRGMRVEDVLSQLQVTDKQAARIVFQGIHSARAEATYKHGLDPDRLLVAGAAISKGFLGFGKKKLTYHGKGNGIKVRPKHQLTVVLREIAPEEEAEIARQRDSNFLYLSKRLRLTKEENKHVPVQLIKKNKGKFSSGQLSGVGS